MKTTSDHQMRGHYKRKLLTGPIQSFEQIFTEFNNHILLITTVLVINN